MSKAPGKSYRIGMSLVQAVSMFSNEVDVEVMFVEARWPEGVACPSCGSMDVQVRTTRKPQPFRCRSCRKDFSVKTGTVMEGSNLPLSKWAIASYIMTTSLKGVSSMKLHRDLGITHKSAWHLSHRIREAWKSEKGLFSGPVEIDETYVGGKRINMHKSKRKLFTKGGAVGKTPVIGARDRESGEVRLEVIETTEKRNFLRFVETHTSEDATVFTDEHPSYRQMERDHQTVEHRYGNYVDGEVHTNSIESVWAMLKRGITGTYHHISPKHTALYAAEFEGRHNARPKDTIDQIKGLVRGMNGKRLRYADLVADG